LPNPLLVFAAGLPPGDVDDRAMTNFALLVFCLAAFGATVAWIAAGMRG
jgi:hypothetical protein